MFGLVAAAYRKNAKYRDALYEFIRDLIEVRDKNARNSLSLAYFVENFGDISEKMIKLGYSSAYVYKYLDDLIKLQPEPEVAPAPEPEPQTFIVVDNPVFDSGKILINDMLRIVAEKIDDEEDKKFYRDFVIHVMLVSRDETVDDVTDNLQEISEKLRTRYGYKMHDVLYGFATIAELAEEVAREEDDIRKIVKNTNRAMSEKRVSFSPETKQSEHQKQKTPVVRAEELRLCDMFKYVTKYVSNANDQELFYKFLRYLIEIRDRRIEGSDRVLYVLANQQELAFKVSVVRGGIFSNTTYLFWTLEDIFNMIVKK